MVSFALAVLAGYGALRVLAWPTLLRRTAPALAGIAALVVVDGYAGPLPIERIEARGSAEDRRVHGWIDAQGPGPVMHLPIADADLRPEIANASVQLTFHYATLLHGQPTVTGGTDFMPVFARWLHGEGSPFRAPADADGGFDMLRRLGVRYVLLHRDEFRTPLDSELYEAGLLAARSHVHSVQSFDTVLALRLRDPLPRHEASPPPPERGPPQRVQCRYLDAGQPDPAVPAGADPSRPSVAATWACALPDGTIDAARWTFDLNRPDTWPARLRVEAGPAGAAPSSIPSRSRSRYRADLPPGRRDGDASGERAADRRPASGRGRRRRCCCARGARARRARRRRSGSRCGAGRDDGGGTGGADGTE